MIPDLTMDDIRPGRSGVRALLLSQDGDTRDDFTYFVDVSVFP